MKHLYINNKQRSLYVLSFIVASIFTSCGTMQTTTNNDGIYNDNTETPQRKVAVVNNAQYENYNENYFTKELKRLDYINGTDVITDIEDYNSNNYNYEDDSYENQERENYQSWGNDGNSNVIVNVNGGFNNGWNNFGWNNYGWNNYGWNNQWGFRRGFRWGYNSYWHPFHSPFYWNQGFYGGIGFYGGFYSPFYRNYGFYGNRGLAFRNNRFYRNNRRYGNAYRRNGIAYNSRRSNKKFNI